MEETERSRNNYGTLSSFADDGTVASMILSQADENMDSLESGTDIDSSNEDADESIPNKESDFTSQGSKLKLTNRAVVAFGTVCLFLMTFGTFFLVIANKTGNWSIDALSTPVFKSPAGSSSTSITSTSTTATSKSPVTTLTYTVARCNYSAISFFAGSPSVQLKYAILDDYIGVIEPYAKMQLSITSDADSDSENGAITYLYSITSDSDGSVVADNVVHYADLADGASETFSIACTPGDSYTIFLARYEGTAQTEESTDRLLCKYVRREFRALTSSDLAATMDAMHALWQYSTKKGRKLYGKSFYDADFFADIHYYNAGWRDSDHIHEGLGFFPQHVKMTNMFEKAMQSVDPSVSLFYWDFTIDTYNGLDIFTTPYFSPDTFGSISSPQNSTTGWTYSDDLESAKIPDGRWAGLKSKQNSDYPELTQAYGYTRAPWNMNPSKYISRFSVGPPHINLPGCGNYKTWFEEKDFAASMKESAYGPHSTTHTSIGGVYGCDVLDTMREAGLILDSTMKNQVSICLKWGFYIKEYYRGNYLTPASECSTESTSCFTCNGDSLSDMLSMMKSSSLANYLPEGLSDEGWEQWQDFICTGGAHKIFVGDHLESASPADPSFWPIHPAQDRLVQARYSNGGFWDYEWPTLGTATDYVCNHFQCYDDETLELKVNDVSCCYGHYENDRLYMPGDRNTLLGDTNHKVMKGIDASSDKYDMPYIYDSFKWDHCGDMFDVESLAEVLAFKALSLDSTGKEIVESSESAMAQTAAADVSESDTADAPLTDSRGYSTVLASQKRQSGNMRNTGSANSDSESTDTGVTAASETVLSTDSKGYATVLASDSRAKGWGDLDGNHVAESSV